MGFRDNLKKIFHVKKNFRYLEQLIYNGVQKGENEIVLDCDIHLSDEEIDEYKNGIELKFDGLVINGNGHFIDANEKTSIFNIATSKSITLKNVVLKNGRAVSCSAIENNGYLTVINSVFLNNVGVAIENWMEIDIIDSSFNDNHGGVIYNGGRLNIDGSVFNDNHGGVIHNGGSLNISNSDLHNNLTKQGGAIYNESELSISECTFTENVATEDGGAIYNIGNLTVEHSVLSTNRADNGGAIKNYGGELCISGSRLSDNSAGHCGGAIINGAKLTVRNSDLSSNRADNGGAISNAHDGVLSITGSRLSDNSADYCGGVIVNKGEITVNESNLSDNYANDDGGVIWNASHLKIFGCDILMNNSLKNIIFNKDSLSIYDTAFNLNSSLDIIYNQGKSNLSIFNGKLTGNPADRSIIYNNGKSCTVSKSLFENNISHNENSKNIINQSDLVLIRPKIKDDSKTILNEGNILIKESFQNLEDKIDGTGNVKIGRDIPSKRNFDFGYLDKLIHKSTADEIVLKENICLESYEMEFYEGGIELDIDNLIINGNGKIIDGSNASRIFIVIGKNITLKNIIFKNGQTHKNYDNSLNDGGGALRINNGNNLTIKNCKFIDNCSESYGGVIDNHHGELTIINSVLSNNDAKKAGAINNTGILNIICSELSNNHVEECGGTITNHKSSKLLVRESSLSHNSAKYGGAVHNSGELNIIDSELSNNTAESGGAIFNPNGNGNVESSILSNNSAKNSGAINNDAQMIISDSKLYCNEAEDDGGAISNHGKLNIKNSNLSNNLARNGGAIWGYSIIENSILSDNSADIGGAICGGSTIKNSIISTNKATDNGGAIYNLEKLNIINSKLLNNSAESGGAIFNHNNMRSCIINSILSNNRAISIGGAITTLDILTIKYSTLSDNSARNGGAIYSNRSLTIEESTISDNRSSENGGAIYNGGILHSGLLTIVKSTISDNSAGNGGAIYVNGRCLWSISESNPKGTIKNSHEEDFELLPYIKLCHCTFKDNNPLDINHKE